MYNIIKIKNPYFSLSLILNILHINYYIKFFIICALLKYIKKRIYLRTLIAL